MPFFLLLPTTPAATVRLIAAVLLTSVVPAHGDTHAANSVPNRSAETLYAALCASCHGAEMRGGTAPSLLHSSLVASGDSSSIARLVGHGSPDGAMPAFGSALTDDELAAMARLLQNRLKQESHRPARRVGETIEAESLNPATSAGYNLVRAEAGPPRTYVGYFGELSALVYDDVDLTGVRSFDLHYARGSDDPGRVAIMVADPSGIGRRTNLGEADTTSTGGWEEFRTRRVGLTRELTGRHSVVIFGAHGGGIFNLDRFTLSAERAENDGKTTRFSTASGAFAGAGHRFQLEAVAEAPAEIWAMAFLPDGAILVTQKNGYLHLFRDGKRTGPILGTPPVWDRSQGGMLGIAPHPEYERNGWIYLAFSDVGPGEGMASTTMTRIVRGRIEGRRWVDQQDIFRASPEFYTTAYAHFGGRMVLSGGFIYFTIGDRTVMEMAQHLGCPVGKVHRLRDDGSVPDDNPFVGRDGVLASIWSYGHRNPQGLTLHPQTGAVWSAEHGPRGGDELNLIERGANYGWPLATFGINYDGTVLAESPYREGTIPPVHHWTPSIAVSQVAFYRGDRFPNWRGHVLAASLGAQELRLVHMDGDRATGKEEVLFKGFGRIRDVAIGPDGFPYIALNHPNGTIYRLVPVAEE
jgi:glucose/arabinose dehydrogenase/mono/diheme cytochrome c family protein